MLRLIMGQLGLSLDDKTLQFWRKNLFETTLHLTKFVADFATCIPQKFLLETSSIGTRLFLPVPLVLPPDTIESDDELHR